MRKSAQSALILGLMGVLACAQGATTPMGEVPAYEDDLGDGDGDVEETGDGDEEEETTGDGDVDTGDGDGDVDTGDGDGDTSGSSDAGAAKPADPIGDFFNQIIAALGGGQPGTASDAGTP